MTERQMVALRKRVSDEAEDGRFELYKTTATHEGPVGRKQHGYPDDEEAGGVACAGSERTRPTCST